MTIKREVIAGLDLGSTKICVFVAEVTYSGKMEVIAIGTAPSSGVNRGLVVDLDSVTQAIRTAVKRAEDLAEFKITEVYVGIAGEHILSLNNKVSLEVQGEVTKEHIAQILD
ncbi:MAG: cell division protein FtsA, partial [bacterium]